MSSTQYETAQATAEAPNRPVMPQHRPKSTGSSSTTVRNETENYADSTQHHNEELQQQQITIAKKVFIGGCFLLPWLWIVNLIYFRRKILDRSAPRELRKWLFRSAIGATIATIIFIVWVILFQTQYDNWGSAGSDLTVYEDNTLWFRSNGPWENSG